MWDALKLNVNPPTYQRAGSEPELKFQGMMVIVTESETLTYVAKFPDTLTTAGDAPFPLTHPVTRVAVLTEPVLSSAPPLIVMLPLICAASSVTPAPSRAMAAKSVCLIVLSIFIFWGCLPSVRVLNF